MKQKARKDVTKSAHLSIRIPGFTRHALEYWEPIERLNDTTFAEKAIDFYATFLSLSPEARAAVAKAMKGTRDETWRRTFHSHPGVSECRRYFIDGYPFDDEMARRRDFVFEHRPFFIDDDGAVIVANVDTLWDPKTKLDRFMALGADDYAAPGQAMAAALEARGLEAPAWPKKDRRR